MDFISDIFLAYPYLLSLFILVILLLAGRLCHVVLERWLKKIVGKTKTKLDDELLDVLSGPIYWSVIPTGIYFAILPLSLPQSILLLFRNILLTLGFVLWGVAASKGSHVFLPSLNQRRHLGTKEWQVILFPF